MFHLHYYVDIQFIREQQLRKTNVCILPEISCQNGSKMATFYVNIANQLELPGDSQIGWYCQDAGISLAVLAYDTSTSMHPLSYHH